MVSCKSFKSKQVSVTDENKPFEIDIIDASLIQETDNVTNSISEKSTRLNLTVSIMNKTDLTLEKVQYKISLNEEAKPFIASGIIEKISDDFFRVVPENSKELQHKEPVNGLLNVCGFEDTWSSLITTKEDLKEFADLKPDDIYQNINQVTVIISWKGGSQQEDIPINLKQE